QALVTHSVAWSRRTDDVERRPLLTGAPGGAQLVGRPGDAGAGGSRWPARSRRAAEPAIPLRRRALRAVRDPVPGWPRLLESPWHATRARRMEPAPSALRERCAPCSGA